MYYAKKKRVGKLKSLVEVAKEVSKGLAENLKKRLATEMVAAAKAWRLDSKIKLSGRCTSETGVPNTTDYPGRCSGTLERNLTYRTYIQRRQETRVIAGWSREFLPFTSKRGFNYADHLDRADMSYGNYKARIYQALDKKMKEIILRTANLNIGRL